MNDTFLPTESNTAVKVKCTPQLSESNDEDSNSRFKQAFRLFGEFVKCLFFWGSTRGVEYVDSRVKKETNEAEKITSEAILNYSQSKKHASEEKVNEATANKINTEASKIKQETFSQIIENLEKLSKLKEAEYEVAYQLFISSLPNIEIAKQVEVIINKHKFLCNARNVEILHVENNEIEKR